MLKLSSEGIAMYASPNAYNLRVAVTFFVPKTTVVPFVSLPLDTEAKPRSPLHFARTTTSALLTALEVMRKVALDLTAILVPSVIVLLFLSHLADKTIILDPPTVPKALTDRGVTPELLTAMLQVRLQEIHETAATGKALQLATPPREALRIEAAGFSLSLSSFVRFAVRFLGWEPEQHLTVSVLCVSMDCADDSISLHAIASTDHMSAANPTELNPTNLAPAIDSAAQHLLRTFDPYILASYFYVLEDEEGADGPNEGKSIDLLEKMVRNGHRDRAWAYNLLGYMFLDNEDYESAGRQFDKALAVDSEFVAAIVNRGNTHFFLKDYGQAEVFYRRALVVDPMRLSAYNNLGWIRLNLCDWEGATWAYEHALAIDPIHPLPLTSLASVKKWRLNDEVTADELVQRARSVDPDSTLSFLARAEKVVKSSDCEGSPMKDPQLADALYGLIDHP